MHKAFILVNCQLPFFLHTTLELKAVIAASFKFKFSLANISILSEIYPKFSIDISQALSNPLAIY